MTTDRDTLLMGAFVKAFTESESAIEAWEVFKPHIDAHDNAMKEQTETDILGRLPASSRTCTCTTCRVVTGKLNQVFSEGENYE